MITTILEKLKRKLESSKTILLQKIKRHRIPPDFGSDVDPDEETEESSQYGNELSLAQTYKNQLTDVEGALKKMKNHKYGVCEKCGKEISEKLLKINPESRFCQDCKKKIRG